MKKLALGEPNECLSLIDKENSNLIHLASRAAVIRYPYISTPTYSGFLQNSHSYYTGETHTVVISVCCYCKAGLTDRTAAQTGFTATENEQQRLWMGFHVCFGSDIFHIRGPGNPKENMSCSQLCTAPIVFHFPHW